MRQALFEDTSVLILAAGASSRMKTPKGLLSFKGRPWIVEQLERITEAGIKNIFIVYSDNCDYQESLKNLPYKINWIKNPQPELGRFASLLCGLKQIVASQIFLLPLDVPAPKELVWKKLFDASLDSNIEVVIPVHQNRGGHPIVLKKHFIQKLLNLPLEAEDSRLDKQIHLLEQSKVCRLTVHEPSVLLNLNTPQDWEKFVGEND